MSKRTINEHISRAKAIPGDIRAIIKGNYRGGRVHPPAGH